MRKRIILNYFVFSVFLLGATVCVCASETSLIEDKDPNTTEVRHIEALGRGMVAVRQDNNKVYVGWRLLGTDPNTIAFNLYRTVADGNAVKLNDDPIVDSTNYVDMDGIVGPPVGYFVRPVVDGNELDACKPFILPPAAPARPYLSLPLQTPKGYTPNDASVGDLDGDGEYEIVLHQVGTGHDNAHSGFTTEPILEAYKLDGTFLWRINLGINIREGAHYTQFMVYDLDGDGRAEVACKTADGTVDGEGTIIGDPEADFRNDNGYILSGPEYLTVFDGLTGAELATAAYDPPRHPDTLFPSSSQLKTIWGDGYGNRVDRFLACIAYLDGIRPSLVMCRGYYTGQNGTPGRTVLAAWNWRNGELTQVWTFDTLFGPPENDAYRGQGNHNLSVADVDCDGKDEIVYGGMCVDDDGSGLYTTGQGHGDAMHLSDMDPERPGLEVWRCVETTVTGAVLTDAATGEVLVEYVNAGDVGRACAGDIDPRYLGYELWGSTGCPMYTCQGQVIGSSSLSMNFMVWWDSDLLRELLDGTTIDKWDYKNATTQRLLSASTYNAASNNGTKSNPCLCADILGDWREEVIWRSRDNQKLLIFTTTIPTDHRLVTLMHDHVYRMSTAWQNVAYNQPTQTGFFMGVDQPESLYTR
jgi:rhamnogalacturonan endolyase